MIRMKLAWKNDAGLSAVVTPVPGSTQPEIIQTDSYGPSDWNGQKAWIFPVDNQGNIHVTVEGGKKKEKQVMSISAFKQFLTDNLMVLAEEVVADYPGGAAKKVKTAKPKPAKGKGK